MIKPESGICHPQEEFGYGKNNNNDDDDKHFLQSVDSPKVTLGFVTAGEMVVLVFRF